MIIADGIRNDANSYVSIEYADNYFLSLNESKWETYKDVEKSALLIKATDYVDTIFDWKGRKKTSEQLLSFPRINLFSKDGYEISDIPDCLKKAVCEAVKVLINGSELFQSVNENGRVTSEHIGQISFSYDVSTLQKDKTLHDSINCRLRGLYKESNPKIIFGELSR